MFKGLNGKIVLHSNYVSIVRENMLGTTFHKAGEIQIPYSSITEVKYVPGGMLNGYLCIIKNGYDSPSSIFSALKNENTVIFRLTQNGPAKKIKQLLDAKM